MRTRVLATTLVLSGPVCTQQWIPHDGPSLPSHGAVYDLRRDRVVVLGGEGETWEYDGNLLLHRSTSAAAPFPRADAGMVYDSGHGFVLVFGGKGLAPLGDTWLWDGSLWRQPAATAFAPQRRMNPGIAFDSWRNRVVMFGGDDPGFPFPIDTWEFDGSQWIQCQPATLPNPPLAPRMAFDSARGVTVLVTANTPLSLSEWNGVDWRARTPAGPVPSLRYGSTLVFDPVRQRTVMIGGNINGNELWEWDGNAWSMPAVLPFALINPALYFDPQRRAVVVMGGQVGGVTQNAAWTWDGITFASLWPGQGPQPRAGAAWIRDPLRHRSVMSGAAAGSPTDTWEWDGSGWNRQTPAASPPPRSNAGTCFDPLSGTCLLFGGTNGNSVLTDFWQWNGVAWTQIAAPGGPITPAPAMAWDSARGEVIAFGEGSIPGSRTWRWNGVSWSAVGGNTGPTLRTRSAMAFDPVRVRMVLFGGGLALNSTPVLPANDTWEWNGAVWQQVVPAQSPPAFAEPSMIHDPSRGRMLLVGSRSSPAVSFEAWEYDGTTWTQLGTWLDVTLKTPRLIWDEQRQCAVLFDGTVVRELSYGPVAAVDLLGNGCGAPPPLLAARTRPRPGDAGFGLDLWTLPGLPVVFALGFAGGSTPIGNGCTLLLQQVAATSFALAGGNGLAVRPIPLPANQSLRGLVLYGQAGVLDPSAAGGLSLSQSLRITVGD